MPVRNEAWCLGLTLRAALQWCDELVVFLHASTDASEQIAVGLARESGRITVVGEKSDTWDEMRHRQAMLELARSQEIAATHLAIIDADELLTANLHQQARDLIGIIGAGGILQLPGYNLRGGIAQYHANGIWSERWFSIAYLDHPTLGWRGDTFHHREPMGHKLHPWRPIRQGEGGVLHLWGASERRLRAKHALYKITERLRWPHKAAREIELEYNLWRSPADSTARYPYQQEWSQPWIFADVPSEWLAGYDLSKLDIHAEPWQEAECHKLYQQFGASTFAGLDLFGVV